MPTALFGTDTANTISRHVVEPSFVDQVYGGNALFFRLRAGDKIDYEGGLQYEQPMITQTWGNVQEYSGYDVLNVTPQDNVKSGGWDPKQYNTSIVLSGTDLLRCNSNMAIANLIKTQAEQAQLGMANTLGTHLHGSAVGNAKRIDGFRDAIDNGSVATSYAGLVRASNTYMNANIDASTSALTIASVATMLGNCTKGAHAPTAILSRQEQYLRAHALGVTNQRYVTQVGGSDVQLLSAGFTNVMVCNVPWIVDDKVIDGPNSTNSAIMFINEEYIKLMVAGRTDFMFTPFQIPPNQDAMVQHLRWWGNLVVTGPQLQGKMTNVSS